MMQQAFLDKTVSLTPEARRVICEQATEMPYSGEYNTVLTRGTYLCRRCGLGLFRAGSQFASSCGWPSFDDEVSKAIQRLPDPDGRRVEIRCARCDAHLGHVFQGEGLTHKNLRHCVNAASIDFVENNEVTDTEEAIVAGGCFWGVDYFLRQVPGVLKVEAGYTGGILQHPSYEQICAGNTGHYEAVRVLYDRAQTEYEFILKRFFEIHDPTQKGGQGPDLGHQYQSAVFYYDDEQLNIAESLIQLLKKKGFDVVTKLLEAQVFWPAEAYHQAYYAKHPKVPYCHQPVSRFK